MTNRKDGVVVRQLRTLFNVGAIRELTDGQLLERFAAGPGEAAELAFAVLLERHGPMVLRVCRGVLADAHEHDTQDAFQATFLVLVKKARGLWVRDSLGPWLHQVAFRTASCARTAAARRRRHERRAATIAVEEREMPAAPDDELGRVLHAEIERLPERYRAPLVLCDLQGLGHEQAARCLGWPVGTVKSRLARGRQRLRGRLVRRGLAPDAGLLAALLRPAGPDALVPAALVDSTAGAAVQFLTTGTIAPGSVLFLAQGVLRSMLLMRWMKVASVVLVLGATASGLDGLARKGTAGAETQTQGDLKAARGDDAPGAAVAVQPGKFRVTEAGRGLVEAAESQDVFCRVGVGATLISIVPDGTYVKKGELVGELDSSALQVLLRNQRIATLGAEAAFQNAKLTREVAEIAVAAYVEGSYKQELETVQGEIAAARSAIPKAEARLARTKRASERLHSILSDKGGAATAGEIMAGLDLEDRIDGAEQTLAHDRMELERAETRRQVLENYTRDRTVKELQSEVEKSKSNELARQQTWELEKDKQARLETWIQNCKLLAPGDGMVLYDNAREVNRIEEGAAVRDGQKIFSVSNVRGPMRVNVKVPEAWVDKLVPGQPVRIKVDAFPGETLTGTVAVIYPLPDSRKSGAPADPRKFYTTHVKIAQGLPGLRPGMSAQAEILIADLDNVLTVPVAALRFIDGKYHVAVKKPDGGFDLRAVTLGMTNGERIEVKQGLQSGDLVIQDPRSLLSKLGPD